MERNTSWAPAHDAVPGRAPHPETVREPVAEALDGCRPGCLPDPVRIELGGVPAPSSYVFHVFRGHVESCLSAFQCVVADDACAPDGPVTLRPVVPAPRRVALRVLVTELV